MRVLVFILFALLMLQGCAGEVVQVQRQYVWPPPPERPRIVYQATLRSADSLRQLTDTDRFKDLLAGVSPRRDSIFAKPYGVAAARGKIVVTDTVMRQAVMFDVPRRKVYAFGVRAEGKLIKPLGVTIGSSGWIFIADVSARNVKVYDSLGLFIKAIGSADALQRPVDVAVSANGELIYVLDSGGVESLQHRVVVFNKDGDIVRIIGSRGASAHQFNLPNQISVGPNGDIFVLDAGNFRIQRFSAEGQFRASWGQVGRRLGDFARPRGLAVDADNNVYVTDGAYRNFQIFNQQGQLLIPIGEPGPDQIPGNFSLPAGIAVDESGFIYVVDQVFRKVEVFKKLSAEAPINIPADVPGLPDGNFSQ